MITTSALTQSLAIAFSVYVIVGGIVGLIAQDTWKAVLDDFRNSPALTFISSVFVFVLGVVLIVSHNSWADPLAVFISLLGWIMALEGLVLLLASGPILRICAGLLRPAFVRGFSIVFILIGITLLFLSMTASITRQEITLSPSMDMPAIGSLPSTNSGPVTQSARPSL